MKNIENISSKIEIRDEIKKQNEKFDIFKFYLDNINQTEILNSGLGVITPLQTLYCYNLGRHEYLVEKIYESMYDDFYEIYKKNSFDYRETAINLNNICIQFLSKYYSMIWMPDSINKYQLSKLFELYDNITRINNILKQKGEREIIIAVYSKGKKLKMFNFIEEFTSIIDMVCDKIKERDEYAIDSRHKTDSKRLTKRQKISL